MSSTDEMWKPRKIVGKPSGLPDTCLPPLGEEWDKKMELAFELCKAGKSMRIFIGCFKCKDSKEGILKNG